MANVGSVEYSIKADTQQFQASVKQASAALNGMGASIGPLMRKLTTLAGGSASAGRSMGVLSTAMRTLGAGNAIQLGIVAGVAAITMGMRYLRNRTNEAKEALDEARKAGEKFYESLIIGERRHLVAKRELLRVQQQQNNETLRNILTAEPGSVWDRNRSGAIGLAARRAYAEAAPAVTFYNHEIQGLTAQIAILDAAQQKIADRLKKERDDWEAAQVAIMGTTAAYEAARSAAGRLRAETAFAQKGFGNPLDFFGYSKQKGMGSPFGLTTGGPTSTNPMDFGADMLKAANDAIAADLRTRREEFQQIGRSLGDRFAEGFAWSAIQGFQGLGALLKNILMSILSSVISMGMKAAGGGIAGFIFDAIGMGGNLSHAPAFAGDVGVTRGGPSMSMSVNVGAASDPFSLARDAQWQMALRESIRFANSQGFRG